MTTPVCVPALPAHSASCILPHLREGRKSNVKISLVDPLGVFEMLVFFLTLPEDCIVRSVTGTCCQVAQLVIQVDAANFKYN